MTSTEQPPGVTDSIELFNDSGATGHEMLVLGSDSYRVQRSDPKGEGDWKATSRGIGTGLAKKRIIPVE